MTARETADPKWKNYLLLAFAAAGFLTAAADHGWSAITWVTGGLKPQVQIDQDTFKNQLNTIQAAQTNQFNEMKSAQQRIMDRLDLLPRPSDYVDQQAHLARIDAAFGAVNDRFTTDELTTKGIEGRVTALEHQQPHRNPP